MNTPHVGHVHTVLSWLLPAVSEIDSRCRHCIRAFTNHANALLDADDCDSEWYFWYDNTARVVTLQPMNPDIRKGIDNYLGGVAFWEEEEDDS